MTMTTQKLTVSGLALPGWPRWPREPVTPYLPLTGEWLREAGFPAGTRVLVEVVEDGALVVRRVEEGEEAIDRCAVAGDADPAPPAGGATLYRFERAVAGA